MDIETMKERALSNLYDYVEERYDGTPLLESLLSSIMGEKDLDLKDMTPEIKRELMERSAQAYMINAALGTNMRKLEELEQRIDEKLKKMAFVIDTLCEEKS